jgi:TetR/AcrR family transcriptional regulator, regulator of cefoperazone and chloramphenicol sensitivity
MSKKDNLIKAACKLFSSNGFMQTSVAEICSEAGANIAAVNYYFSSKENLYREVWSYAYKKAEDKWPVMKEGGTDEERLRYFIENMINRIFDKGPAGMFPLMIGREITEPSDCLQDLIESFLMPIGQYLISIIKSILGSKADPLTIYHHKQSIIGQYSFYSFSRSVREIKERLNVIPISTPEQITTHIVNYSLAGLRDTRERLEL